MISPHAVWIRNAQRGGIAPILEKAAANHCLAVIKTNVIQIRYAEKGIRATEVAKKTIIAVRVVFANPVPRVPIVEKENAPN